MINAMRYMRPVNNEGKGLRDPYPVTMKHNGKTVGVTKGENRLEASMPEREAFAFELPYPPKGKNLVWSFDIHKDDQEYIRPLRTSVKDGRYRFEFSSSDRAVDFGQNARIKFSLHNAVLLTPGYVEYPPVEEREVRMKFSEGGSPSIKPYSSEKALEAQSELGMLL